MIKDLGVGSNSATILSTIFRDKFNCGLIAATAKPDKTSLKVHKAVPFFVLEESHLRLK